jgi:hypothetical protein
VVKHGGEPARGAAHPPASSVVARAALISAAPEPRSMNWRRSTLGVAALRRVEAMKHSVEGENTLPLGRPDITWTQVRVRLPNDGTGALSLLWHIILN